MNLMTNESFYYKNSELYCEDVLINEIINEVGTPTYIYSKNFFISKYKEFDEAFKSIPHKIFYAVKSNSNLSVIRTFKDLESGFDVNSEGELFRVLKVGTNPKDIILTGVGKTENEIRLGIENNLSLIKAESEEEVYLINKIAAQFNKIAPVAIRINPDVDAKSHPYISTGLAENKFGMDQENALKIFSNYQNISNINFLGIDMHIGSQITSYEPFVDAVEKLSEVFFQIKKIGIDLKHFDIGGGIGVQYNNEEIFSIKDFAETLIPKFKNLSCNIFFEPGRFLTANGGILVTKVLYSKKNKDKNFIIVDAAMNDLLRPSIYKAYHHIQPVKLHRNEKDIEADIVGPVCESSDFLAKNRLIQSCHQNDFLSVIGAGAYGMVMASNYNSRRRPAEVMVDGSNFKVIRKRETFEDLINDEEKLLYY
ncbi:MAG: diaminopimelate decarboxylase [Ignavibacterium sp.]